MKSNLLIISAALATMMFTSACTSKPFVRTGNVMSYDMTDVDISTLKSSKVCTSSENNDVSVRYAAEVAGFSKVYAVDNEIEMESHLFGADTVRSRCTIIYGR